MPAGRFSTANQGGPVYKIKRSQIINHADVKNFDVTKSNIAEDGVSGQQISNFNKHKDQVNFKSKLSRNSTGAIEVTSKSDKQSAKGQRIKEPDSNSIQPTSAAGHKNPRDLIDHINYTRNSLIGLNP